jgi:hypothetical protein
LFRADVLRRFLAAFTLPERVAAQRAALLRWAELFTAGQGDSVKEHQLLRDFEKGDWPFVRGGLCPFSTQPDLLRSARLYVGSGQQRALHWWRETYVGSHLSINPLAVCACGNCHLGSLRKLSPWFLLLWGTMTAPFFRLRNSGIDGSQALGSSDKIQSGIGTDEGVKLPNGIDERHGQLDGV